MGEPVKEYLGAATFGGWWWSCMNYAQSNKAECPPMRPNRALRVPRKCLSVQTGFSCSRRKHGVGPQPVAARGTPARLIYTT